MRADAAGNKILLSLNGSIRSIGCGFNTEAVTEVLRGMISNLRVTLDWLKSRSSLVKKGKPSKTRSTAVF